MTARTVLLAASGGGHWLQLRRLRPAFEGHRLHYLTTDPGYAAEVTDGGFHVVNDANRWNKLALAWMALRILIVVVRVRPDIVISTGAAPGYFALRFGRLLGARTIWLDSIANAEELSLSGQLAGKVAHLWLTQWPEVARPDGPHYEGSVV